MTALNAQTAHCYCSERQTNPALADELKAVPEGYCGFCDVCGEPGHTHAHPSAPVTGCWCNAHEPESSGVSLAWVFNLIIGGIVVTIGGFMLWRALS